MAQESGVDIKLNPKMVVSSLVLLLAGGGAGGGVSFITGSAASRNTAEIKDNLNAALAEFRTSTAVTSNEILHVKESINSLRAEVASGTNKRYTSDDAARDREGMLGLIKQVQERNLWQDDQIVKLNEFKAKHENRQP